MQKWLFKFSCGCVLGLTLGGCASNDFNKSATDAVLTGTGGVLGYKLSNGRPEATAAGAAAGYLVSKVAQAGYQKSAHEAEKAGYDRAMNQAVKQQYWIIQNQQKSITPDNERDSHLVPVVIPETNINGVIVKAHVEYLRVEP
ncbi:MAG: hypothetical protein ABI273_14795 [Lacunisphaera sp.]